MFFVFFVSFNAQSCSLSILLLVNNESTIPSTSHSRQSRQKYFRMSQNHTRILANLRLDLKSKKIRRGILFLEIRPMDHVVSLTIQITRLARRIALFYRRGFKAEVKIQSNFNTFNFVRASLSQKLNFPSDPTVANVPNRG